jgi:hypothetical protein
MAVSELITIISDLQMLKQSLLSHEFFVSESLDELIEKYTHRLNNQGE